MKFVHSKYLLRITHRAKINFASTSLFACYILLLICFIYGRDAPNLFFGLSLVISFVIGTMSSMGDLTLYGFLKALPSKAFNGFAAGAGFSGVIGALLPIIVTSIGFDMKWVSIYSICFFRPKNSSET